MKADKIDFSSIDPARDSASWERRIRDTALAAAAAKKRCRSLLFHLAVSVKPAIITAAAAACFCIALAVVLGKGDAQTETTVHTEPALALAGWAAGEELPPTDKIIQILGGTDVEK